MKIMKNNRKSIPVDGLHKTREIEQVNILLEALYKILDDKNQNLEKSRMKLKKDLDI